MENPFITEIRNENDLGYTLEKLTVKLPTMDSYSGSLLLSDILTAAIRNRVINCNRANNIAYNMIGLTVFYTLNNPNPKR